MDVSKESCSICFEDLDPASKYHLLCTHSSFHEECINKWLNEPISCGKCPLCRRIVRQPNSREGDEYEPMVNRMLVLVPVEYYDQVAQIAPMDLALVLVALERYSR